MRILLVEDEESLSDSINKSLLLEGYNCDAAYTYIDADEKIHMYDYDHVILDINLPDGNGLNLIEKIKGKNNQTGIIIISARDSVDNRIEGLDKGADDYIIKPFSLSELNARLNSLSRRVKFEGNKSIIYKELEIFPEERSVLIKGNNLELTKKEYDLLLYFVINKNRVLTKESITEHLWGDYADVGDPNDILYSHIKNLRKKFMQLLNTDYIKTVYGVGYKLD